MNQIRVGIIGTGFMAVAHIRAYQQVQGVEIGALCNPSGRNLDGDFSDVHGNLGDDDPVKLDMTGVKAFRDYDEMLADDLIDLIDITTPTFLHHEQALAALAAGKHVLCEKPLARTGTAAREIAAAPGAKSVFMPAILPCGLGWFVATSHSASTILGVSRDFQRASTEETNVSTLPSARASFTFWNSACTHIIWCGFSARASCESSAG